MHAADCGDLLNDTAIGVMYSSTLEGSPLTFWCQNYPDELFTASCQRNSSWSPDPSSICLNRIFQSESGTMAVINMSGYISCYIESRP